MTDLRNRSASTAGLDDPRANWMQRVVRVTAHPEWGCARVVRYFPPTATAPERLRIMADGGGQPQIVRADEVVVLSPVSGQSIT